MSVAHDTVDLFPSSHSSALLSTNLMASNQETTVTSSVSLNRSRNEDASTKPPVWSIDRAEGQQVPPLQAVCSRHVGERQGVCCKELKPDDERQLLDPDVVRDAVIGLSVRGFLL
jgi:hypothetical protein